MALIKIKGIKTTPKATINYIENEEKTIGGSLTTGINCLTNPDVAAAKMEFYRERYQVHNKNKAFHVIHSYSSKEKLTPEQAHEISLEWFKKNFPNDVIAIASTHTNTESYHTHFLVNNVCLNGDRLNLDRTWHREATISSNEICKAHGLKYSIIENKKMIPNKSWYEYQQEKLGQSWKQKIREDIDRLIVKSRDIDHLYSLLAEEGYELKTDRKYVAIRPQGKERFVRINKLGFNYSPEQLKNRILGLDKFDLPEKGYYAKGYNSKFIDKDIYVFKHKKSSIGTLIQLTGKIIAVSLGKYENNPKYTRYNKIATRELKAIEKALNTIQNGTFETREDVVKEFNNIEIELAKISKWKSKTEKKLDEIDGLAEKLRMVNNKENELNSKKDDLKNVLNAVDYCINKKYKELYKDNEINR